jgi:hepatocyte growth factor-regulated tyrosine kinase substrate
MPLPHLGIAQSVRVCETCYEERNTLKTTKLPPVTSSASPATATQSNRSMQPRNARVEDDYDRDLKLALEMSLEEAKRTGIDSQSAPSRPEAAKIASQPNITRHTEDNEDEELKAAIAASLKDMEEKRAIEYPKTAEYPPVQSVLRSDSSNDASIQHQVLLWAIESLTTSRPVMNCPLSKLKISHYSQHSSSGCWQLLPAQFSASHAYKSYTKLLVR